MSIEKTGKTVAEAVAAACRELGCSESELQYAVLQEPKSGFLGLFGRQDARIRAAVKQAEAPAAAPVHARKEDNNTGTGNSDYTSKRRSNTGTPDMDYTSSRESSLDAAYADERADKGTPTETPQGVNIRECPSEDMLLARAERFLQEVLEAMHLEVGLYRHESVEGTVYELSGERLGLLIGKHGQTLDALQYLANLAANRDHANGHAHIILDIEGYRSRREDTLMRLAGHLAEKACRICQEIHLEPMNRHERKIIHTALQDNRRVSTYSAGEEPRRYVVIVPKRRRRSRYSDEEQGDY